MSNPGSTDTSDVIDRTKQQSILDLSKEKLFDLHTKLSGLLDEFKKQAGMATPLASYADPASANGAAPTGLPANYVPPNQLPVQPPPIMDNAMKSAGMIQGMQPNKLQMLMQTHR